MREERKTTLYDMHLFHKGKIVDFGGWSLPLYYTGIIQEHLTVRSTVGLFDVSHMGEIEVKGPKAEDYLQWIATNEIRSMQNGAVRYSLLCYPDGGIVDDVLIYKLDSQYYLIVVNASNVEKDYQWMIQNSIEGVQISNRSDSFAQLALQGPNAVDLLNKLLPADSLQLKYYQFIPNIYLSNIPCMLSRTGYTGEDGFELYVEPKYAVSLWQLLMKAGADYNIQACGLGARDSLRLEASMPLYGHEIDKQITPLEAGLSRFVKLDGCDFIGKEALTKQKQNGIARNIIGFEMVDKAIARNGYKVHHNHQEVGIVTSGTFSPTLQKNIGTALINSVNTEPENTIEIEVRGKYYQAKIVPLPFYKRENKKGVQR